jgi:2,5-diketo-D-gluconate reductase A
MQMNQIKLNDGNSIPQLGYGLWQVSDEETVKCVGEAIKIGYRSIDSAQIYQNETGLGQAIKNANRSDLFITTKIWNSEQGRDSTLKSFDVSMKKLGIDRLDLLLIHWPAPKKNLYVETWKALISLKEAGRVKSIGVSNFMPEHLQKIIDATGVVPAINQIELHPYFQQKELRSFHKNHNIQTESWSPLGQGKVINDPIIKSLGQKYQKTPAQIILRWHMENGLIAIPKSVTPGRIQENFNIFDFKLEQSDLQKMEKLDSPNGRIGPNPMTADF